METKGQSQHILFYSTCVGWEGVYETGMGLCLFLVRDRDAGQLFSGGLLECSGADPGVCMRIPAVLQMLRMRDLCNRAGGGIPSCP